MKKKKEVRQWGGWYGLINGSEQLMLMRHISDGLPMEGMVRMYVFDRNPIARRKSKKRKGKP